MAFQSARFIHILSYLRTPCALTAHFHPYPTEVGRLFSVTLAVLRRSEAPPVRWRGALYCPDFPPVPHRSVAKGDKAVCNSGAKLMGSLGFLWVNSGIVYCFIIPYHRSLLFLVHIYKGYTFSLEKKSYPLANFKKLKISASMLTSYFFSPKKVGKKGFG
jgi:hypothetical protein